MDTGPLVNKLPSKSVLPIFLTGILMGSCVFDGIEAHQRKKMQDLLLACMPPVNRSTEVVQQEIVDICKEHQKSAIERVLERNRSVAY